MRSIRQALTVGTAGGTLVLVAFGWTFVPLTVATGDAVTPLPPLPKARVEVDVLRTGSIASSHGLSVRGGSMTTVHSSEMTAVGIRHPKGYVLVDTGVATDGVAHLATTPWLMQAIVTLEVTPGLKGALKQEGHSANDVDSVLLTHAHWDHVSGLADLPGTPVWMTEQEEAFAKSDAHGALFRQLDADTAVPIRRLLFADEPYGPFASHSDLFGDGTVIVVPLPGHTPGSVGIFVHTPHQRLLFVGDTAWTHEGVDWPAEKPWISRRMVDHDPQTVRSTLGLLHQLQAQHRDLLVVPAHDGRVHDQIIEP